MPSSIATTVEIVDVKEPVTDKFDVPKAESACRCGLCSARKPDFMEVSCDVDRERPQGTTGIACHNFSTLRQEESYPDVPRTASAVSLPSPTPFNDDSLIDITLSRPSTHMFDEQHLAAGIEAATSQVLQRDSLLAHALQNRSASPRIFAQITSTQSNLSLPASFEAFRPAIPLPAPPAVPEMALPTFIPFFRRVEEREMISCQICLDEEPLDESVILQTCVHAFGKECMRSYILSRLDERRYPIPCPCCSAAEDAGSNPGLVTSGVATQVNLSDADCARWDELEFQTNAVRFECRKCHKSHSVDRRKLVKEKSKKRVFCPTEGCPQIWCRNCQADLDLSNKQKHVCEGKKELKILLKKEGWRQCPGCNIPVQKSSGCNHIACSAPGCNTHFCYRCGQILIRSVFTSEIHEAISSHFRRRLYFWRCSQFHDPNFIIRMVTRGWRR